MIDIDKLTEAQLRYILKILIEFQWSDDIYNDITVATELDDYPQQNSNEESDND
jgi:hypothetical protein